MVTRRQVEWSELSNGSFLITVESDFPAIYQLGLLFPEGTADDPRGREGLSQLSLPLLGKETAALSREELQRKLDLLGALVDSDTMDETSILSMVSLDDSIEKTLSLFHEIFTRPATGKKDFKKERKKLITNFQVLDQDPEYITEIHARSAFFGPGHTLSRQARPRSVKSISLDMCKNRWERLKQTGPLAVFFSGPRPHAGLKELYLGTFAKLGSKGSVEAKPAPSGAHSRTLLKNKNLHQVYFQAMLPVVPRTDPLYLPLRLGFYAWVEGGFASRLMTLLRVELGGTYGIHGQFQTLKELGVFHLQTSFNADQLTTVLSIIQKEYERLRKEGLSNSEFTDIQNTFINAYPLLWDNVSELGSHLLRQVSQGVEVERVFNYPERVRGLTLEEVNSSLKQLPEEITTIVLATPEDTPENEIPKDYTEKKWLDFL